MVIRLDAKPRTAAASPAAVPQQKSPANTAQVRESRDHLQSSDVTDANPSSPVVMTTVHNTSTVTTSISTPTAAKSSSSSLLSTAQKDNDFVRTAINIEGSKVVRQQQPVNPSTVPPVTRFVKKAAAAKDVERRHTAPLSPSPSSDSVVKRLSCDNNLNGGVIPGRSVDQPTVKEDRTNAAAVTASDRGYNAAFSKVGSDNKVVSSPSASSTEAGRSLANRIAVFEQQPTPRDNSQNLSSSDVTSTSSVTRQKTPIGSQSSVTGSIPAKYAKRQARSGKFTLNSSAGGVAKSTVPPSPPCDENKQKDLLGDEDQGFDVTRL